MGSGRGDGDPGARADRFDNHLERSAAHAEADEEPTALRIAATPDASEQLAEVDRLVGLGAATIDIGQGDVPWIVMADPDGNKFCVLAPRKAADTR